MRDLDAEFEVIYCRSTLALWGRNSKNQSLNPVPNLELLGASSLVRSD